MVKPTRKQTDEYLDLGQSLQLEELLEQASLLRDQSKKVITFSKKVFIPLTMLCRDVCHYCTFAKVPRKLNNPYLRPEEVLNIAQEGKAKQCKEALFTLGEKPELRYQIAKKDLHYLGYQTTLDYLHDMAKLVLEETGLLPHLNPGTMTIEQIRQLREVSPSMGIMLESSAKRLCEKGQPHFGSPDKDPELRLRTIRAAGKASVPLTTGILIGIGETRQERIESLLAIKETHLEFDHIQEIIVQNFIPKADTKMRNTPAPELEELLWTLAMSRIIFGPGMNIQCPPNLNMKALPELIGAGINDWGGVSPVTQDHVNPESPWPELKLLEQATSNAGKKLQERLTIYPEYITAEKDWFDPGLKRSIHELSDSEGYGRHNLWRCGESLQIPETGRAQNWVNNSHLQPHSSIILSVKKARKGQPLDHSEITELFKTRGHRMHYILDHANALRQKTNGDIVSYVITRNINYTNICKYTCHFCAFSKGKTKENLRGKPYLISYDEIADRALEAWQRGATEVCLQGGIHPHFNGNTYLDICRAIKAKIPGIHIHAFSPLEIHHGAMTLGYTVKDFLLMLKEAGLNTMPGTAAEILDDRVRDRICPDKINSARWLEVIATAHEIGINTTSTIMFGHQENISDWATHLLKLRNLQKKTEGITEFVPLPFVCMESPMYKRGHARPGPTFREVLLMHAIARLSLNPLITNIQTSWVKLGQAGAEGCLNAGANDMGGTLMNESISRAAGSIHGQEFTPDKMESFIKSARRVPRLRDTMYNTVNPKILPHQPGIDISQKLQTLLDSPYPQF